MTIDQSEQDIPCVVSVSRRIKDGREADYEQWVHDITEAAAEFPGHQGVSNIRPSRATGDRYVLIYRFDTWNHAKDWEDSSTRHEWVAKLDEMVEGDAIWKRASGLEVWFDLPEIPATATPQRWRMSLVLVGVIFCMVFPLQMILSALAADLPYWLRSLIAVVIQVLAMTYVVMPVITKRLRGWLFR